MKAKMVIHLCKVNGNVTDGRTLDECCRFLPNGDYVATIEAKADWERRQPRTRSQNALCWVWFADIANFFNKTYGDDSWNKDNVHDLFCEMFRSPVVLPNGQVIDKWVETSKLNKRQMTDFMNKVQSYMATEHGATVPLPDDERYNDFHDLYSTM